MRTIGIFTHDLYPFKPWGQGRYVHDLVRHVVRKWDGGLFVFSPSDGIEWPFHVRLFPGSHNTPGKNISFSLKLISVLEDLIDRYRLDLVHFQGGPGGLFLFKRLSVPVLYTVHHTYFQQQKYIRSQRWKYLLYLLEKCSYRKTDQIIAVSPSTRNVLLGHYSVLPGACSVIPNGVDLSEFHPLHQIRRPNSLLFLGRLELRKGIDFLIRVVRYVRRTIPDVKVYIAGGGTLDRSTVLYIKRHHLTPHLSFEGTIPDKMVNVWYNRVMAVVIPSVFEGFGLTAIESMASGTPVIATDVDGLRDIITDGENGFLVAYGDIHQLTKKIIILLRDSQKRERLVQKGLSPMYFWDNIADEMMAVYQQIFQTTP